MSDQPWAGAVVTARPSPLPKPGSPLHGYSSEFSQQHHVLYVGADNHVYELYNLNAWKFNDLTQLTGSSHARATSPLNGYVTSFNQQQHVNFVGEDGHIHEIYYDGSWKSSDLGGNLFRNTPLAGYQTGFNQQQHVICLDSNDRVTELLYDGAWNPPRDLTDEVNSKGSGVPQPLIGPASARQFCGYSTEYDQQQHVIFMGEGDSGFSHIYELYYAHGSWYAKDLTEAAGPQTPLPLTEGALAAYPTEFNRQHHVIFVGKDATGVARIYELYYGSGAWKCNDLSSTFGPKPPAPVPGALAAYATGFNQQEHVIFIGAADNHIYEIYYAGGSWHTGDLTLALSPGGPPAPVAGTWLAAYATDYNQQQHVISIGNNAAGAANIYEIFYSNGSWQWNDLTNSAVIPITQAQGEWNVPFVSTPDQPQSSQGGWQSSTWVGIDGSGTNDVLQAGTSQRVDSDGVSTAYYAWYQWFAPEESGSPDYIHETWIEKVPVNPGDIMSCKVEYIDNNSRGRVTLSNLTNGTSFTEDLDPPPGAGFNGNSAEWITEAPTHHGNRDSLPQFSPVHFIACSAKDIAGLIFDPLVSGNVSEISLGGVVLTSTTIPASGEVDISYA